MVGLITLPPSLSGFYLENYNENESACCIILVKQLMQNMNLEQKCTNGTGWLGADCGNEDFFCKTQIRMKKIFEVIFEKFLTRDKCYLCTCVVLLHVQEVVWFGAKLPRDQQRRARLEKLLELFFTHTAIWTSQRMNNSNKKCRCAFCHVLFLTLKKLNET